MLNDETIERIAVRIMAAIDALNAAYKPEEEPAKSDYLQQVHDYENSDRFIRGSNFARKSFIERVIREEQVK